MVAGSEILPSLPLSYKRYKNYKTFLIKLKSDSGIVLGQLFGAGNHPRISKSQQVALVLD